MPDTPVKLINLGQLTTEPVVSINVPQSQRKAGPMSYYVTSAMTMLSKVGSLGQHSIQLRIGAQTGDSAGLKFYRDKVKTPLSINVRSLTPAQVAYSPDGNWIYSGGHWDNSVRGYHIPEQRTVFHRLWHSGRVTCLSVDAFGSKLITGSADHSCCIWAIEKEGTIKANPLQTLFGHSCPISGCAISTELDMAVSASGDGVTNIYTVRKGVFIRTLQATNHSISAIPAVTLSRDGYIVFPAISRDQVSFESFDKTQDKSYLSLFHIFIFSLRMERHWRLTVSIHRSSSLLSTKIASSLGTTSAMSKFVVFSGF